MNEIIRYGLGINLVQETLNFIINQEINLVPKFKMYINVQYLIVLFTGKLLKVSGRSEALNSEGVIKVLLNQEGAKALSSLFSELSLCLCHCQWVK